MGVYLLRRKIYSRFDDTDRLKGMKDSDILAERERKTDYSPALRSAAVGAAGAGAAGAIIGGTSGLFKKGKTLTGGLRRGFAGGALAGGVIAGGLAYRKLKEQDDDNSFYNRRLNYAKRQAMRRERADWKRNMTTRDGYSY